MLALHGDRQGHFCDGVSRRQFLRVGALGVGGLTLPGLLRARAASGGSGAGKSVIMICLPGGPSHIDTYDMKPDAPEQVRGEFAPTATNVPGLSVCDLMPLQTRIADKLAVVRNMKFIQPDHQLHEVYTGYPTAQGRPAFGSVVSRVTDDRRSLLPRYISLSLSDHPRTIAKAEIPTYLGGAHRPFEPSASELPGAHVVGDLTASRLQTRKQLLRTFDALRRGVDARRDSDDTDIFTAQALEMVTSPEVRDAFDLTREPARIRERYGPDVTFAFDYQFGRTWFGPQFLMARRIAEAGVPVVTLGMSGWDHHGNVSGVKGTIFERSREQLPLFDRSIHALVTDLHERGRERDIAVVVWGEFGRTPTINKYGGRDHWPSAGFALFAGGGWRTGQVIGQTTSRGEHPRDKVYRPQNVLATLYHHLGIDPAQTLPDVTGRPLALLDDREPISELL
jgi:hypothetical protein